jgi:hydroxysqualene synthase
VVTAIAADASLDSLQHAYATCARLARDHYENFPVASFLLPRRMRPAIAAIYAFARTADDFADEPGLTKPERLGLLDGWLERLHSAAAGRTASSSHSADDLIFLALGDAMRTHRLPVRLFEDLLSAFRQDVTVSRYQTWTDVLDYCSRSANPVGRLVLRVAGHDNDALDRASDALCTALQLTNFWQDFARDWRNGRLYVPRETCDRAGAREEDLDRGVVSPAWRAVFQEMSSRTRALFVAGRPVCDGVGGRLKFELRFTWLGGARILDKLERTGFDVFNRRPTIGAGDVPALVWRAASWPPA